MTSTSVMRQTTGSTNLIVSVDDEQRLVVGRPAAASSDPISASHYARLTLVGHDGTKLVIRVLHDGTRWIPRLPDQAPQGFGSLPQSYGKMRNDPGWKLRFFTHNDAPSGEHEHRSETWPDPMIGVCVQVYLSEHGFKSDLGQIDEIVVTRD